MLITPDEVIKQSPTESTVDPKKLLSAIEIAEERFVRTFLGWDLYESIVNEKNTLVTSGNKASLQTNIDLTYHAGNVTLEVGNYVNAYDTLSTANKNLWNNRLWKFIAECVRFVAMPEAYAVFSSQGIMKNHPSIGGMSGSGGDAASVSLADLKFLMDKWMGDRIETLQDALHEYLGRNIGDYPTYIRASEFNTTNTTCADHGGNSTSSRKVGWMTDIYDDEEKRGCTWDGWPTS